MNIYSSTLPVCLEITKDLTSRLSNEFNVADGTLLVYTLPDKRKNLVSPYYLSVQDCNYFLEALSINPSITVIAMTSVGVRYLSERLSNKVIYIDEFHCNYDNELRDINKEITTVGYIGCDMYLNLDVELLRSGLKSIGLELKTCFDTSYLTRQKALDFYRSIDIALAFRKPYHKRFHPPEMKGTVKLSSPSSFGIPTVAFHDYIYRELDLDCYLKAYTVEDIVSKCKELKNSKSLYSEYSNRALEYSKDKHIDIIAKQYDSLII